MDLGSLTAPHLIFADLPGADGPTALRALAERLAQQGVGDADELYRGLSEREQLGTTALGGGVAVPHCKIDRLDRVVVALGVSSKGVEFGAEDSQPVRVIFVVLSPRHEPAAHLQSLAAISKWVRVGDNVGRILRQQSAEEIYRLLSNSG